jgi:hypothetical protein
MAEKQQVAEIAKSDPESLNAPSVVEVSASPYREEKSTSHGFLGFFHILSIKLGAETTGCERLPEEDRDPTQGPWSQFSVWAT